MYVFDGDTITIPYGDSADIGVTLEQDGVPYMLTETQRVRIDLMHPEHGGIVGTGNGSDQTADGTVSVFVPQAATKQWRGKYPCMVRLEDTKKKSADTVLGYDDPLYVEVV